MMKWFPILVLLAVAIAAPAFALEGTLLSQTEGGTSVIVWRSGKAMEEGFSLIRAKADARIIMPLIACAPRTGTRVIYSPDTEGSMWSGYAWPVTILEGQFAGCRGFVPSSSLKK